MMHHSTIAPKTVMLKAVDKCFTVHYTNGTGSGLQLTQPTSSDVELQGRVSNQKGCLTLLRWWLQVRGQKTRWGSCSSTGTISLNYKLLFLPSHLVNYIIIHELCHTVHLNHSATYWSFLSSFEPNCKILDKEMKGAGQLVPRWVNWRQ